jgi:hypothetical protein
MKLWITRDKRGTVRLFQEKPILLEKSFFSVSDGFGLEIKQSNNNRTFLKHIVFEDSPKQLKIELL